jgi:hypothetical protein
VEALESFVVIIIFGSTGGILGYFQCLRASAKKGAATTRTKEVFHIVTKFLFMNVWKFSRKATLANK